MKVRLQRTWFAPSNVDRPDAIRSISGRRFKKGEHDLPDDLKEYLPRDAMIILEDGEAYALDAPEVSLKDYDQLRAQADAAKEAEEKAEKNRQKMAKVREAKAQKKLTEVEEQNGDSNG